MSNDKKRMTGMLIHSFAVAHAVAAAVLAQTIVGDEAVLTALTIAMIIAVAKMNGADWDTGSALAFLGVFAGTYLGVRGATFLIKWIPGIGNAANAFATFGTTEVLGWVTYIFVKKGKTDPKSMSKEEKDELWNEAQNMREQEKDESERLYNAMSSADKSACDDIMKQLKDKNISDSERNALLDKLQSIMVTVQSGSKRCQNWLPKNQKEI